MNPASKGKWPSLVLALPVCLAFLLAYSWLSPRRSTLSSVQGGIKAGQVGAGGVVTVKGLDGDGVLQRFSWALQYINLTENHKVFPEWQCPDKMRVGARPPWDLPRRVGTTCEPWMVRGAITLLHELLLPGTAKALEWSTGSSTVWLLMGHVGHLTSIEHDTLWADAVRANVTKRLGAALVQERWTFHHIPPYPPDAQEDHKEDAEYFKQYIQAGFLDDSHLGTFDYISIDGRARAACFPRALALLRPHGGVLVLDNSERGAYRAGIDSVPSHWLRRDFTSPFQLGDRKAQRTTVWVSCRKGQCGA